MKEIKFNNLIIIIGQNKYENDKLLTEMNKNFTWFHVKNKSSPHLWVNKSIDLLNKNEIYRCALELKKNSPYKKYNNIAIIYTQGINLIKTNILGSVYTKKAKTINV